MSSAIETVPSPSASNDEHRPRSWRPKAILIPNTKLRTVTPPEPSQSPTQDSGVAVDVGTGVGMGVRVGGALPMTVSKIVSHE